MKTKALYLFALTFGIFLISCKKDDPTPITHIKGRIASSITPQQLNEYDSLPFNISGVNWMTDEKPFITVGNESELPNPENAEPNTIYFTRKPPKFWRVENGSFVEKQIPTTHHYVRTLYQLDTVLFGGPIKVVLYHTGGPYMIIPKSDPKRGDYYIEIRDVYPPYEYEFTTNEVLEWECELVPDATCQLYHYGVAVYVPDSWEDYSFPEDHIRRPWSGGWISSGEEEAVKHGESKYLTTEILYKN